jgi:replication factor C subunit 3/5
MQKYAETIPHNIENIPWVEKYRPNHFDTIVLDPLNRTIFENILKTNIFPNLLFYGPPGTGKTTTIINLINEYLHKNNQQKNGMVIHLNASDERGIDVIRNQIFQFVKSKNLFEFGMKFVILDEVDYLTKNAQQALKILLQSSSYNVRFCLICNYISKMDESLKNEFICIRFNQLPKEDIYRFIRTISIKENINLDDSMIYSLQQIYDSDIRSMINFIQLNQNITDWSLTIVNDALWEKIHNLLLSADANDIMEYIDYLSIQYNIDKLHILKNYFNYIIRKKKEYVNRTILHIMEDIMHLKEIDIHHIVFYFVMNLQKHYHEELHKN